jgi:hypothetical protein
MSEEMTGRRLGDFEVVRELGRGGRGVVAEQGRRTSPPWL